MYSPLSIFVCAGRPLMHIKMKGRPINMNSVRQQRLRHMVPGRPRGRPVDPDSIRQHLIAKANMSGPPRPRGRPVDPQSMRQYQLMAKDRPEEMQNTHHISFAEIIEGRDSNVRMTEDGLIYAVDLVMVMSSIVALLEPF